MDTIILKMYLSFLYTDMECSPKQQSTGQHVLHAIIFIKNIDVETHICLEYPWEYAQGIGNSVCFSGGKQGD